MGTMLDISHIIFDTVGYYGDGQSLYIICMTVVSYSNRLFSGQTQFVASLLHCPDSVSNNKQLRLHYNQMNSNSSHH